METNSQDKPNGETSAAGVPDPLGVDMTLLEHLTELRSRLIRILIAVGIGFAVSMAFAERIFGLLSRPLIEVLPESQKELVFTGLPEVFFVYIKMSIFCGILLASPVIFYQLWKFVAPGLYKHEKKYILPFVIISTIFFMAGAGFSYFQIFPWGFKFFIGFTRSHIKPMITIKEYLKFSTRLLLAFGCVFEMPIVISFLARLGIVTPEFLRRQWKYAVVFIFILAAILTPPDVITQMMMAGPMLILYEISIWAAKLFSPRSRKKEKAVSTPKAE